MRKYPIVALIYDFDGTLSPGNMQEFGFIQAIGKKPQEFWQESDEIALGQDASNILSYMKLMFDEARKAGIKLRREDFKKFGESVELFNGVKEWFGLINEYGKSKGVKIEHYINSSGLAEMIEGTAIAHEFKRIYACSFLYNKDGEAEWPGVAVDYTAKTQFIFKINKGVESVFDTKDVNRFMEESKRPVPFSRMIYFGDGTTDIPCMKLVKNFGGHSIAVYNPEEEGQRTLLNELIRDNRVNHVCPADYSDNSEIDTIVKTIIDKVIMDQRLAELEVAR